MTAVYRKTVERLKAAQDHLARRGFALLLSLGDTPSCSLVEDFNEVDEIRPGNFVFYDLMQWRIGACTADQIAVAVACPVVAVHPEREQIVLYGGAVHLSKERLGGEDGRMEYGRVAPLAGSGRSQMIPGAYLAALSQEHGVIQAGAALCETSPARRPAGRPARPFLPHRQLDAPLSDAGRRVDRDDASLLT